MSRIKGHDKTESNRLEQIENMKFAIQTSRDDLQIVLEAIKQERPKVAERLIREVDKRLERATKP